jgi:hypothetical protein
VEFLNDGSHLLSRIRRRLSAEIQARDPSLELSHAIEACNTALDAPREARIYLLESPDLGLDFARTITIRPIEPRNVGL